MNTLLELTRHFVLSSMERENQQYRLKKMKLQKRFNREIKRRIFKEAKKGFRYVYLPHEFICIRQEIQDWAKQNNFNYDGEITISWSMVDESKR